MALNRVHQVGLDLKQHAGKLSGGQRAQLALTLAIAKRPQLLMLDEPIASLDPLARREFLQILMESFRLAWNQSVSRARWIAVKLGLVGLAAMATAGLLSLMTSWWASPIYVTGDDEFRATLPFGVTIRPATLVRTGPLT